MKIFGIAVLMLVLALSGAVYAQDIEIDYFARYEDIPQSRTEDGAFILGEADAPVTIVEFADFMCPHCQNYQSTVNDFIELHVATGQAKFEYRFYPIVHPTYSVFTAQIAECAELQRDGAFWASHDLLYDLASDGRIGPDTPEMVADTLSLNGEKIEACLETATQHETDALLGESLGINGTPATTIRLPDGTLGWAYLREQIWNRGGLPLNFLTEIVEADDHAEIVVVPQPLLSDLVSEDACAAPCWRSITPGETPIEDVADVIRGDKQNVEISVEDLESGAQAVTWRMFNSELDDSNYIVGSEDGIVEAISLLDISQYGLGDVLTVQGEPELALAVANNEESALLYAIYPEKSLIVLGFVVFADGLGDETTVIGAQYFSPSAMEGLLADAGAVAWTGYEALDAYMRQ